MTSEFIVGLLAGRVDDVSEVDEDVVEYLADMVDGAIESGEVDADELAESVAPFLAQLGGQFEDCDSEDEDSAVAVVCRALASHAAAAVSAGGGGGPELVKLGETVVVVERDTDVLTKGNVMVEGTEESKALMTAPYNLAQIEREKALKEAVAKEDARRAAKAKARAEAAERAAARAGPSSGVDEAHAGAHVVLAGTGRLSAREDKSQDVNVEGFSLAYGAKVLLEEATLHLAHGRRYGLVGRNGVGKSTLLSAISRGELPIPSAMTVLYVKQEVEGSDSVTALEAVLEADERRAELLAQRAALLETEDEDAGAEALVAIETELAEMEADAAPARAAQILSGLQFTPEMQSKVTNDFSGGWRMRIALARALFHPPDLLIADEPTNHLDLHALVWLEEFLSDWPTTLLVVSHLSSFLDAVCTDIIHQANRKLDYYKGGFSDYVRASAEKRLAHERALKAQKDEIAHMEKFVTTFRYKTKGAKMAQSRLKKLDKIERLEELETEATVVVSFQNPEPLDNALLDFQDVSFAYPGSAPIFQHIEPTVQMGTRVTLVGKNGAGKSTFLKLAAEMLAPSSGYIVKPNKLRIGFFDQHFVDALDLSLSPLEFFKKLHPEEERRDLRRYLGRFGLGGELGVQVMRTLSGGQKARVIFAKIAWSNPHLLLLDEPTNHADAEYVNALIDALNVFSGAVIVVTHDPRLIQEVCNELWLCEDGQISRFEGGFTAYRKVLMKELGL